MHPAQQHRAEHHIITPRHRAQHPRPHQMPHRGGRHTAARAASRIRDASSVRHRARASAVPGAVAVHISDPERRRRLGHIPQQPREIRLMLLPRDTEPGLRHEVAERHRGRQFPGPPGQHRGDLPGHHVQRGVIRQQVMHPHQRQPGPAGLSGGMHVQQRRPAQVHPRPRRAAISRCAASCPGSTVTSVTGSAACRHTTCTGSARPSQASDVR